MKGNQKYISPEIIYADLTRVYKSKSIQLDDIIEWSAICETRYLKDIMTMVRYFEVPLKIIRQEGMKPRAELPCNVYTILDVYNWNGHDVSFYNNGSFLIFDENIEKNRNRLPNLNDENKLPSENLKREDLDVPDKTKHHLYINYIGTNIDKDGMPLIALGHEEAVQTFCKLRLFEEDMALGKFSPQIWAMWDQKFSGQVQHAQSDFRNRDRKHMEQINTIRGNMITRIGKMDVFHLQYSVRHEFIHDNFLTYE